MMLKARRDCPLQFTVQCVEGLWVGRGRLACHGWLKEGVCDEFGKD